MSASEGSIPKLDVRPEITILLLSRNSDQRVIDTQQNGLLEIRDLFPRYVSLAISVKATKSYVTDKMVQLVT